MHCQEKNRKTKMHWCKNSYKRKVRQQIKEQEEANKNWNTVNVTLGRQFPSLVSVVHSLDTDLIKYALPSFNYNNTITLYMQCPDLQKDIEVAAALLVNVFIIEQAMSKVWPNSRTREPPAELKVKAESIINEDSYEMNNQVLMRRTLSHLMAL